MSAQEYTYTFADVRDELAPVYIANSRTPDVTEIRAAIHDQQLASLSCSPMPAPVADIVDMALAVYVADRFSSFCDGDRTRIHVTLPVRHPELLNTANIAYELHHLLYLYTGDEWSFHFRERCAMARVSEQQAALVSIVGSGEPVEVALWSGGLDAMAGLYSRRRQLSAARSYTLLGTGGNSIIHDIQRQTIQAARESFPDSGKRPITLIQVPIELSDSHQIRKNRTPRTRGFVFLLLGAVCALLEGQDVLHVYENGIGAINLPFRSSEVGLDHSRAVHPVLLRAMGRFVSLLVQRPFRFFNPFEFKTKGQVCAELINDGIVGPIDETISCDRRHRRRPMQCGRCTSCLLRRQALAVNSVQEPTDRYVITLDMAAGKQPGFTDRIHLQAMLAQVEDLKSALRAPTPWIRLEECYVDLADVVADIAEEQSISAEAVQEDLRAMYEHYVLEWGRVRAVLCQGLLPDIHLRSA
jgi:hypothetical protein